MNKDWIERRYIAEHAIETEGPRLWDLLYKAIVQCCRSYQYRYQPSSGRVLTLDTERGNVITLTLKKEVAQTLKISLADSFIVFTQLEEYEQGEALRIKTDEDGHGYFHCGLYAGNSVDEVTKILLDEFLFPGG